MPSETASFLFVLNTVLYSILICWFFMPNIKIYVKLIILAILISMLYYTFDFLPILIGIFVFPIVVIIVLVYFLKFNKKIPNKFAYAIMAYIVISKALPFTNYFIFELKCNIAKDKQGDIISAKGYRLEIVDNNYTIEDIKNHKYYFKQTNEYFKCFGDKFNICTNIVKEFNTFDILLQKYNIKIATLYEVVLPYTSYQTASDFELENTAHTCIVGAEIGKSGNSIIDKDLINNLKGEKNEK
ncbi:putative membrane protein [Campylobacter blaseri]|uniref:Uncharacterized protein n=1 Tax=Campylobacter blaseri TaxID=2042961 RepID=A0A2P8QYA3_9BACT|nr:hypothetical protein [Campylobacter blaseri]PSM51236.1 hypothetical protein CQ405_08955 [Campylobacter blaseri]PSM52380.1 hypothetical protein CRN67_08960 [Campylobacter blaseri]QKF86608.1 putative membrane protein [Campylobacter blaseri]